MATQLERLTSLIQAIGSDIKAIYGRAGDCGISLRAYGYIGNGIADDSAAFQAAINAAPAGSTLVVPPGTTCRLVTPISIIGKSLKVVATGVKIVKDVHATLHDTVILQSGWETIYNVSALSVFSIVAPTGGTDGLQLTLSGSPNWQRGDIVRLIADDEIPGSVGGSATHFPRVAQFVEVDTVNGTTVTVAGKLFDPFTTNIRVAKIKQARIQWEGGIFSTNDTGGSHFQGSALYRPVIRDVDILNVEFCAFRYTGCYAPVNKDCYVGWTVNSTSTGQNGYGVDFSQSEEGLCTGLRAKQVRHATDGGGQSQKATLTGLSDAGRTMNCQFTDCIVDSPTSSGFSMHAGSIYTTYQNCTVRNGGGAGEGYGFGLRGQRHTMVNCTVEDTDKAVVMFDDGGTLKGDSFGLTIDGLTVERCNRVFDGYVGTKVENPNYQLRQYERTTIRNVHARNMNSNSDFGIFNNGHYIVENISMTYATGAGFPSSGYVVRSDNAMVQGKNWTFDFSRWVGGLGPFFQILDSAGNSMVILDGVEITGNTTRITKFFSNSATAFIRSRNIFLDAVPTTAFADPHSGTGYHDWECRNAGLASSQLVHHALAGGDTTGTNAAWNTSLVGYSRRDVITATFALTAAGTLSQFPVPARIGQMMVIMNVGTTVITINPTVSTRALLTSGASTTIAAGRSMTFVCTVANTWRQVSV